MKKNLTLVIPEDLLRRARVQAVHEGTSVNEIVRTLLERYVGRTDRVGEAMEELIRLGKESGAKRGRKSIRREDAYDRRVFRDR